MKEKQRKEALRWKAMAGNLEEDRKMLDEQVKDAKKQNKLLKIAIGRLQKEIERGNAEAATEEAQQESIIKHERLLDLLREASSFDAPPQKQAAATAMMAPTESTVGTVGGAAAGLSAHTVPRQYATHNASLVDKSQLTTKRTEVTGTGKRNRTASPYERYRAMGAQTVKFPRFLDVLFESKMSNKELQQEIRGFVQARETAYCNKLQEMRKEIDLEKQLRLRADSQKVNEISEKNELEGVFVDCIEEVRKDMASKRRGPKKPSAQRSAEEAKEFEESLVKLAQLARRRATLDTFTPKDRTNLLDLFVNNEKTLLKIYEALFPHRTSHIADKTRGRPKRAMGSLHGNKSFSISGITGGREDAVMKLLPLARGVSEDEGRGGNASGLSGGATKLPALNISAVGSEER